MSNLCNHCGPGSSCARYRPLRPSAIATAGAQSYHRRMRVRDLRANRQGCRHSHSLGHTGACHHRRRRHAVRPDHCREAATNSRWSNCKRHPAIPRWRCELQKNPGSHRRFEPGPNEALSGMDRLTARTAAHADVPRTSRPRDTALCLDGGVYARRRRSRPYQINPANSISYRDFNHIRVRSFILPGAPFAPTCQPHLAVSCAPDQPSPARHHRLRW